MRGNPALSFSQFVGPMLFVEQNLQMTNKRLIVWSLNWKNQNQSEDFETGKNPKEVKVPVTGN